MEKTYKINMNNDNLENLLETYRKKSWKEPPLYLKRKVMNRIEEEEVKREHIFNRIIANIKDFLFENKTQVLSFALSMLVLLVFTTGILLNYINVNSNMIGNNNINMLMENIEHIDNSNDNIQNAIPIKIYSVEETSESAKISVNGEDVPNIESNLLMELNNNYNHVKVNNGAINLQIEGAGYIKAHEGTVFKIDVYQRENTMKDIYIIIDKGEIELHYIKTEGIQYEYYIEGPSAIIEMKEEAVVNVSVLDEDTIINVKKGSVNTFNNIRWNSEITNDELNLINQYVNLPENLDEDNSKIYIIDDVIEYSEYINQNYKRLIRQYIND